MRCEKEEYVLKNIAPASSTLLPDALKEPMSIFLDVMKSICKCYEKYFRNLLKAPEDVASDSLEGEVDLALADPT